MYSPLVFVNTLVDNGLSFDAAGFKVCFPYSTDIGKFISKNLAAILFYLIDRLVFEHACKSAGEIDDHFFKTAIVLLLEESKRTNMNEFFIDYPWEFGLRLFVNFRQRILRHEYLPITLRRFIFLLNFFDQNQLKAYLPFVVDQIFLALHSLLKYIASKKVYDQKTIDYCLESVLEILSKFAPDLCGVERFADQNCDYNSKITLLRKIIANRSRYQLLR
uniref:Uncharacterized protein n=1 Tax=Romanomermis culicivorax TaxID=13658 RepID=A0A915IKH3_ROMCU